MEKRKIVSKTNDSVELWTKFLEYLLERLAKRYNTVEELADDVNQKFKDGMEVIQQNYDRWFKYELKPNMNVYGIELLGDNEDIVIEESPEGVNEDEFLTDEERQAPENIDEENFFEDEGTSEQPSTQEEKPTGGEDEPFLK